MQIPELAQASRVKRQRGFPSHTSLTVQLLFSHLGGDEGELSPCERAAGMQSSTWEQGLGLDTQDRPTWVTFQGMSAADREELPQGSSRGSSDTCEEPDTPDRSDQGAEVIPAGSHPYRQEKTGHGCDGQRTNPASATMRQWSLGSKEGGKQGKSSITALDLRRAVLGLQFRDLLGRLLGHTVLERGPGKPGDF